MFEIKGKVAVITGGASGIGLRYAKELLKNELKAVTLADVNPEFGKKAVDEITKEFGANKAIFVETDVTNYMSFENAFQKTVDIFKNLDILINNAGILNDKIWEKEIAINLNGVIHGMLLGLENYMPKYKSGKEGVIVNISSIAGTVEFPVFPVYCATKFAVLGLTKSWGYSDHYNRTHIKVIAMCPGVTITPLITEMSRRNLGPQYERMIEDGISALPSQPPECVAAAMVKIIRNGKSGSAWVAEGGKEPYEYIVADRNSYAPK